MHLQVPDVAPWPIHAGKSLSGSSLNSLAWDSYSPGFLFDRHVRLVPQLMEPVLVHSTDSISTNDIDGQTSTCYHDCVDYGCNELGNGCLEACESSYESDQETVFESVQSTLYYSINGSSSQTDFCPLKMNSSKTKKNSEKHILSVIRTKSCRKWHGRLGSGYIDYEHIDFLRTLQSWKNAEGGMTVPRFENQISQRAEWNGDSKTQPKSASGGVQGGDGYAKTGTCIPTTKEQEHVNRRNTWVSDEPDKIVVCRTLKNQDTKSVNTQREPTGAPFGPKPNEVHAPTISEVAKIPAVSPKQSFMDWLNAVDDIPFDDGQANLPERNLSGTSSCSSCSLQPLDQITDKYTPLYPVFRISSSSVTPALNDVGQDITIGTFQKAQHCKSIDDRNPSITHSEDAIHPLSQTVSEIIIRPNPLNELEGACTNQSITLSRSFCDAATSTELRDSRSQDVVYCGVTSIGTGISSFDDLLLEHVEMCVPNVERVCSQSDGHHVDHAVEQNGVPSDVNRAEDVMPCREDKLRSSDNNADHNVAQADSRRSNDCFANQKTTTDGKMTIERGKRKANELHKTSNVDKGMNRSDEVKKAFLSETGGLGCSHVNDGEIPITWPCGVGKAEVVRRKKDAIEEWRMEKYLSKIQNKQLCACADCAAFSWGFVQGIVAEAKLEVEGELRATQCAVKSGVLHNENDAPAMTHLGDDVKIDRSLTTETTSVLPSRTSDRKYLRAVNSDTVKYRLYAGPDARRYQSYTDQTILSPIAAGIASLVIVQAQRELGLEYGERLGETTIPFAIANSTADKDANVRVTENKLAKNNTKDKHGNDGEHLSCETAEITTPMTDSSANCHIDDAHHTIKSISKEAGGIVRTVINRSKEFMGLDLNANTIDSTNDPTMDAYILQGLKDLDKDSSSIRESEGESGAGSEICLRRNASRIASYILKRSAWEVSHLTSCARTTPDTHSEIKVARSEGEMKVSKVPRGNEGDSLADSNQESGLVADESVFSISSESNISGSCSLDSFSSSLSHAAVTDSGNEEKARSWSATGYHKDLSLKAGTKSTADILEFADKMSKEILRSVIYEHFGDRKDLNPELARKTGCFPQKHTGGNNLNKNKNIESYAGVLADEIVESALLQHTGIKAGRRDAEPETCTSALCQAVDKVNKSGEFMLRAPQDVEEMKRMSTSIGPHRSLDMTKKATALYGEPLIQTCHSDDNTTMKTSKSQIPETNRQEDPLYSIPSAASEDLELTTTSMKISSNHEINPCQHLGPCSDSLCSCTLSASRSCSSSLSSLNSQLKDEIRLLVETFKDDKSLSEEDFQEYYTLMTSCSSIFSDLEPVSSLHTTVAASTQDSICISPSISSHSGLSSMNNFKRIGSISPSSMEESSHSGLSSMDNFKRIGSSFPSSMEERTKDEISLLAESLMPGRSTTSHKTQTASILKTSHTEDNTLKNESPGSKTIQKAKTYDKESPVSKTIQEAKPLRRESPVSKTIQEAKPLRRESPVSKTIQEAETLGMESPVSKTTQEAETLRMDSPVSKTIQNAKTLGMESLVSTVNHEEDSNLSRESLVSETTALEKDNTLRKESQVLETRTQEEDNTLGSRSSVSKPTCVKDNTLGRKSLVFETTTQEKDNTFGRDSPVTETSHGEDNTFGREESIIKTSNGVDALKSEASFSKTNRLDMDRDGQPTKIEFEKDIPRNLQLPPTRNGYEDIPPGSEFLIPESSCEDNTRANKSLTAVCNSKYMVRDTSLEEHRRQATQLVQELRINEENSESISRKPGDSNHDGCSSNRVHSRQPIWSYSDSSLLSDSFGGSGSDSVSSLDDELKDEIRRVSDMDNERCPSDATVLSVLSTASSCSLICDSNQRSAKDWNGIEISTSVQEDSKEQGTIKVAFDLSMTGKGSTDYSAVISANIESSDINEDTNTTMTQTSSSETYPSLCLIKSSQSLDLKNFDGEVSLDGNDNEAKRRIQELDNTSELAGTCKPKTNTKRGSKQIRSNYFVPPDKRCTSEKRKVEVRRLKESTSTRSSTVVKKVDQNTPTASLTSSGKYAQSTSKSESIGIKGTGPSISKCRQRNVKMAASKPLITRLISARTVLPRTLKTRPIIVENALAKASETKPVGVKKAVTTTPESQIYVGKDSPVQFSHASCAQVTLQTPEKKEKVTREVPREQVSKEKGWKGTPAASPCGSREGQTSSHSFRAARAEVANFASQGNRKLVRGVGRIGQIHENSTGKSFREARAEMANFSTRIRDKGAPVLRVRNVGTEGIKLGAKATPAKTANATDRTRLRNVPFVKKPSRDDMLGVQADECSPRRPGAEGITLVANTTTPRAANATVRPRLRNIPFVKQPSQESMSGAPEVKCSTPGRPKLKNRFAKLMTSK